MEFKELFYQGFRITKKPENMVTTEELELFLNRKINENDLIDSKGEKVKFIDYGIGFRSSILPDLDELKDLNLINDTIIEQTGELYKLSTDNDFSDFNNKEFTMHYITTLDQAELDVNKNVFDINTVNEICNLKLYSNNLNERSALIGEKKDFKSEDSESTISLFKFIIAYT